MTTGPCPAGVLGGQVAVVTGGTDGIGLGVALALGRAGARVVVCSRRADAVAATERRLRDLGVDAAGLTADVREPARMQVVAARAADRFGGLDILVNCAGGSFGDRFRRAPLMELDADDMLEAYRANTVGAFIAAKAVVPAMRAGQGGSIVFISSVVARHISAGMAAYGAAKAALDHLTRSLAHELAPAIRVNAVAPGHIDTPRTAARRDATKRARQMAETPIGRYGTPEDVAGAVVYLASPAAAWVTGEVVNVTGGL